MTDYGKKLEKEYRDGMVVGAIYNFIGRGTHGWRRGYRLASFMGTGENLQLVFENLDTGNPSYIHASDIEVFSLISEPKQSSEPMNLVKVKNEEYEFDEKAFYRATGGVRHFLIEMNHKVYEALYLGPTFDGAGIHVTFARKVGYGNDTVISTELYRDRIILGGGINDNCTEFKLYNGDSVCTHEEIKKDDIFKIDAKLEWDIDKLKVGKAYRIRNDIDGNETDGIYRFLYEPTIPGQSSIVFAVVSDKGVVGTCHVYQEDLANGKIEIYELTCRKGTDDE